MNSFDLIVDFVATDDSIVLDQSIFSSLSTGTLGSLLLQVLRDRSVDGNDYILYNTTTGAISYDSDGSGSTAAIQFATLYNKPTISAADFFVLA